MERERERERVWVFNVNRTKPAEMPNKTLSGFGLFVKEYDEKGVGYLPERTSKSPCYNPLEE